MFVIGSRSLTVSLKCDAWDDLLVHYHNKQITDYWFGWPVTYSAPNPPNPTNVKHGSALRKPQAVDTFIDKEWSKQALLGPFSDKPFTPWTQTSPSMIRDKLDGSGKQVIIDSCHSLRVSA